LKECGCIKGSVRSCLSENVRRSKIYVKSFTF